MNARKFLESVGSGVRELFIENRTLLSFEEWADDFLRDPLRQARSSAQYLRDAIDHFGSRQVETPLGPMRRFRLFDLDFDDGVGAVHGQEEAQNAIYRILGNFVQAGRADKLIFLHGPNGSAKSSLVAALARGLEAYSRSPEGAMYRINWLFPGEKVMRGSIGFGGEKGPHGKLATFAHLDAEQIDATLACELKDHPIFLIPRSERRRLLEKAAEASPGFVLPQTILDGELCHKCRQIYARLMGMYGGDYLQMLRHVQVERFFISRRYMVGAVTLEPQLSADASYAQITADHSAGQLPTAFLDLDLYSPYGPLVYANRGLIEFSDLLKRAPDSFKYLLGTTETGVLGMEHFLLHLDEVMIATANEKQLDTFKEAADFPSFKGRIEFVRVPYLRAPRVEQAIYDDKLTQALVGGKHIAPHATEVAALWAVLTRLERPDPKAVPPEARRLVEELSPLEKVRLYEEGLVPPRLNSEQSRILQAQRATLYHESQSGDAYEGRMGASAREMQTVLLNASQSRERACLSPIAVLEELHSLCREKSVFEFLQQPARDGYQDPERFLAVVEEVYLDAVDHEVRASLGLFGNDQVRSLFEDYVRDVSQWLQGERRGAQDYERPAEERMREVEAVIRPQGEARDHFRRGLVASIGAWRLDHPEKEVAFEKIFPEFFRKLRDHFFAREEASLRRKMDRLLAFISSEGPRGEAEEAKEAEATLARMREDFGYCDRCAREAIAFLLARRYGG